ncbi:hypothetical protein PIECOFPK_00010 [Mycovorax composti]|uniref:Amidinotransferase n=2 Tax=Chitinophagaceae TaxID=563835 RepID=A0ABZ2EG76_9BACT
MTTSHILMVRPAAFGYNPQTAVNNVFQQETSATDVQTKALQEFDHFAEVLQQNGVNLTIVQDTNEPHTPDSIFPNNWISFHEDGTVALYPMFALNRRVERDKNVLDVIKERFHIRTTLDLTHYEGQDLFLEGTGSMVLDRDFELAYACLSPRTSPSVLYDFCDAMGYRPVLFEAYDKKGKEIYHTNVMMCIADEYVVICLEAIKDDVQRQMLLSQFAETGKSIVEISMEQMFHFAGNMLQIHNNSGEPLLVMSSQAYHILTNEQRDFLRSFNPIVHAPLATIEAHGGGSARCMMAEIFLTPKTADPAH